MEWDGGMVRLIGLDWGGGGEWLGQGGGGGGGIYGRHGRLSTYLPPGMLCLPCGGKVKARRSARGSLSNTQPNLLFFLVCLSFPIPHPLVKGAQTGFFQFFST